MHPARQRELECAAERAVEDGDGELAARLLLHCGDAWRRRPADAARMTHFMNRLESLSVEDLDTRARLWVFRAQWYLGTGDRPAAKTACIAAVDLARTQSDPLLRSDIYREVGNLGLRLALPMSPLGLLDEAVDWARRFPQSECLAIGLSARGGGRIDAGHHALAEKDLYEAIHVFEILGDLAAAARCKGRIATLRKIAGRYEESRVLYRSAMEQMSDSAPAYDRANLRSNHANLLADLGLLVDATRLYEDAIEICHAGGEPTFAASVQGCLATVLAEQLRYDEARLAFGDALRVHRLNGSRKQAAYCMLGLAGLAMDIGDLTTAADLLDDLATLVMQLAVPELTVAYGLQRAVWLTRRGEPGAALDQLLVSNAEMKARRIRSQRPQFLFASGLADSALGHRNAAQGHAQALRQELKRLSIGASSVLWRRLAELDDAVASLKRSEEE